MNNLELRQRIVTAWDEAVCTTDQPVTLAESTEQIWPQIAAYLETADRDFEAEARSHIKSVLGNERQNRSNQLHREADWIMDHLTNPGDAGFGIEALLDRAFPLGTARGEDKALRYWTPEDLNNKIIGYYRVAADATESAKKNDTSLTRLMDAMRENDVRTVGGLIPRKQAAA